jgi:hypothetical protein
MSFVTRLVWDHEVKVNFRVQEMVSIQQNALSAKPVEPP